MIFFKKCCIDTSELLFIIYSLQKFGRCLFSCRWLKKMNEHSVRKESITKYAQKKSISYTFLKSFSKNLASIRKIDEQRVWSSSRINTIWHSFVVFKRANTFLILWRCSNRIIDSHRNFINHSFEVIFAVPYE